MQNEPDSEGLFKTILASISSLFVRNKPYIREPRGLLQPVVDAMYINNVDGYVDFDEYHPADTSSFAVRLELFIRIDSEEGHVKGSARFDITICTPNFVLEELKEHHFLMGHGFLFVPEYSSEKIKSRIEAYVKNCKGNNVADVIRRVGLLGEWEDEWEIKSDRMR